MIFIFLFQTEKFTIPNLSAIHCELNIPVPDAPLNNHESDDVSNSKQYADFLNDTVGIEP